MTSAKREVIRHVDCLDGEPGGREGNSRVTSSLPRDIERKGRWMEKPEYRYKHIVIAMLKSSSMSAE